MASTEYFPPLPELYPDEDMISLLSTSLSHEPAAQTDTVLPAQPLQDTKPTAEDAEFQAQLSESQCVATFDNCVPTFADNTMPVANPNQTHHIKLEPAIRSYVSRPEVMQAAAQAQRQRAALDAMSLVRNGKRFLKPWRTNLTPVRLVEMLSREQLDESIQSHEQLAAKLLGRYAKIYTVLDMLDGAPSGQSNDRIRESLLKKLREIVASLVRRKCLLTWDDFEMAKAEAERRREVWFAVLLVRLIETCLQIQYIDFSDNSTREYWFQEDGYRMRCCELEAWRAACQVLSSTVNEQVQRLEERVFQYLHGQSASPVPSKSA